MYIVVVPGKLSNDILIGTVSAIWKQAKLGEDTIKSRRKLSTVINFLNFYWFTTTRNKKG